MLGFVVFLVIGVIEWLVGVVVYIFKYSKGWCIMGYLVIVVYFKVLRFIFI